MPALRARVAEEGQMDAFIVLPEDLVLSFGQGKRPPVDTTINGVPYRTRVMVYGGRYLIGIRKDVVAKTGARPGTDVDITIELDQQPREVTVPDDLAAALAADAEVKRRFEQMSFTTRKEYARWVEEAKKPETRERRVLETVERVRAGKKFS